MDLQGKVIVVTGAAQGLGRKTAEVIARHGTRVALVDIDHAKLRETAQQCARTASEVRDYVADVTSEAAVQTAFEQIQKDFGRIDGLISNAGTNSDALLVNVQDGKVQRTMSLEAFNKVIAVDLTGVFLCGREAAVRMIEGGRGGVIINISSISRAGNVGQTNYSAAKAAVAAMTVTWARELSRYGIRVAGIAPGFCDTRMVANIKPQMRERIISRIPLGRLGQPEEIGRTALFILQNDYCTGRTIEIDGGLRL